MSLRDQLVYREASPFPGTQGPPHDPRCRQGLVITRTVPIIPPCLPRWAAHPAKLLRTGCFCFAFCPHPCAPGPLPMSLPGLHSLPHCIIRSSQSPCSFEAHCVLSCTSLLPPSNQHTYRPSLVCRISHLAGSPLWALHLTSTCHGLACYLVHGICWE